MSGCDRMKWIYVRDASGNIGKHVCLKGWVYHLRSSGKIRFLVLRDGTGIIQCVITADRCPKAFEIFDELSQESSCVVSGVVNQEARAPGGFEIVTDEIQVIHKTEGYPITPKEHGVSFLMQHRHLWIRSLKQNAILRIRAEVMRACRDFLDSQGFIEVDAPIITPASVEGTTTLFEIDYFGEKAFLSQSGQLYNEATCAALGRVYCFGPTFRAEKSKTRRHLSEFWMLEPEIAFGDLEMIYEIVEGLVCHIVERVLQRNAKDLETLERDRSKLEKIKAPFPKITYDQALALLKDKGYKIDWGEDLGGDEETALSLSFDSPVFVSKYPAKAKAFYMQPDPQNPQVVMCTDLLAPEGYGEIVGGSERIWDIDLLKRRIEEFGLPSAPFEWYLDLRRYGSVPHAGFGLGIERTVAWICGIKHVREAIPFPRLLEKLYQ